MDGQQLFHKRIGEELPVIQVQARDAARLRTNSIPGVADCMVARQQVWPAADYQSAALLVALPSVLNIHKVISPHRRLPLANRNTESPSRTQANSGAVHGKRRSPNVELFPRLAPGSGSMSAQPVGKRQISPRRIHAADRGQSQPGAVDSHSPAPRRNSPH